MTYSVVWKRAAEQQLAAIWISAVNRKVVADAADLVDSVLRIRPTEEGESREGRTRIWIVDPLAVHFDVSDEDRLVQVLSVRLVSAE